MKTSPPISFIAKLTSAFFLILGLSTTNAQVPALWGMTNGGGTDDVGVIFRMAPDGTGLTAVRSFAYDSPGSSGDELGVQLWQSPAGKLYGVLSNGGTNGGGVLYEYDPTNGNYIVRHNFLPASGSYPINGLVPGTNGKLYGMTSQGGTAGKGVIYEFDYTTNTYSKKVDFTGTNGASPSGGNLYLHSNGKFYGFASFGGSNNFGVLFEYDPATNTYTKKIDFTGANGKYPYTSLTKAGNNKLYTVTLQGGTVDLGTLIEYDPASNVITKRLDFSSSIGSYPASALVEANNGNLYGTTVGGGTSNVGVLFEFNPSTNTYIKKLDCNAANGNAAIGGMTKAANGKLYGLMSNGGATGSGVLYEYDPASNAYAKKFEFTFDQPTNFSANGYAPRSTLLQASSGLLYGTTSFGGNGGRGTLFEFNLTNNTLNKKADFNGALTGKYPYSGLIRATNGKLYGMTNTGGTNGEGVIFEIDPITNSFSKKHDFSRTLGSYPNGGLVVAPNGKLYGFGSIGGVNNEGVIFEFDPTTGMYAKKHDFDSNTTGENPYGSLMVASNGKLYGMTSQGGANGAGTIFEYDPATTTITKKADFDENTTGSGANGELTQAINGKFYGLSVGGGLNGNGFGVLFEFDLATNSLTAKVSFNGANGQEPRGSLLQAPNGKLYGNTNYGGANSLGTLFEFDPTTNAFIKKIDFDGVDKGSSPSGSLTLSSNGKIYGGTVYGGANDKGVLFEYDLATNTLTKKHDFNGGNGQSFLFGRLLFVKGGQTITFAAPPDKTIGDTPFNLTASSSAGLPITFSTTSTKVNLSENQVTLVSPGRVSISASQAGNANYDAALVVERSFCIKPTKPTITVSNPNTDSPTLTSSATAGNQWFRNGAAIAGATSATYSVTQPGIYKVQVSVEDCASEFSNDQPMIVTGDIDRTDPAMTVYPNPVSDVLTVSLGDLHAKKEVSIIDLNGRKIESKEESGTEARFNVSSYYAGTYLVKVKSQNTVTTIRFIKK